MKNKTINSIIRQSEPGAVTAVGTTWYNLYRTDFMGSGAANCIDATSDYSVLVGGYHNCHSGSDQSYSFIAGGKGNTSSGKYSSILGGLGNTITHNYAAIFGNGLVSCSNDTFHVSCLNAVNTPNCNTAFALGTVMWKAGNTLGAGDCVLILR